jgi:transglycosylase-like protein with SLT domain
MQSRPTEEPVFGANFSAVLVCSREYERVEMLEAPVGQDETFVPGIARKCDSRTVAVYARHKPECPNKGNPYWRKCRCTKYFYIYANGSSRQISAKTRSWEKAEETAQDIRESFDPAKQLQREIEAKTPKGAVGLMQLMPDTAARLNVRNRCDINENVSGGVRYLAWLMGEFHGDLRLTAAAYYAGERVIATRGLQYANPDVVAYVASIRERVERQRKFRSASFERTPGRTR